MCNFPHFGEGDFATVEPKIEDLNGKYVPTEETLKYIASQGGYDVNENRVFIRLLPNGDFVMQDIPDWWLTDFGQPQGCLINGEGQWDVVQHQDWWELRFAFPPESNLCLEKYSSGLTISVPIVGDDKPYSLWFTVGDPDRGNAMIFQKFESP